MNQPAGIPPQPRSVKCPPGSPDSLPCFGQQAFGLLVGFIEPATKIVSVSLLGRRSVNFRSVASLDAPDQTHLYSALCALCMPCRKVVRKALQVMLEVTWNAY
eukprot:1974034-Amphidinium_carterae.1